MKPVVLCFLEGEAGAPGPEGSAVTRELFEVAWSTELDKRADADLYFEIGAGSSRADVQGHVDVTLRDRTLTRAEPISGIVEHASYHAGVEFDVVSLLERQRCSVHVFAKIESPNSGRSPLELLPLVEALAFHDLPIRLHLVLDPKTGSERTLFRSLEPLVPLLEGKAQLATIAGAEYVLAPHVTWENVPHYHRAVVRGYEGLYMDTPFEALDAAYGRGETDRSVYPTRFTDYFGVRGELAADFSANSPVWEWHGDDVGLIAMTDGVAFARTATALLGRNLPDDVEKQLRMQTYRVFAFPPERLVSFAPIPGSPLRSLVEAGSSATLPELAVKAAKRVVRIHEPALSERVHYGLTGERHEVHGVSHEVAGSGAALDRATAALREDEADLIVVAVASGAREELDEGLARLIGAVRERQAHLVLVVRGRDADRVAIVHDRQVRPADAPKAAPPARLFSTLLDLLALGAPDEQSAPSLLAADRS